MADCKPMSTKEILDEYKRYIEIGTVEEFKNYKHTVHIAEIAVQSIEKEKAEVRAKAIEEFAERMKEKVSSHFRYKGIIEEPNEYADYIDEIAEQLKGGVDFTYKIHPKFSSDFDERN